MTGISFGQATASSVLTAGITCSVSERALAAFQRIRNLPSHDRNLAETPSDATQVLRARISVTIELFDDRSGRQFLRDAKSFEVPVDLFEKQPLAEQSSLGTRFA